MTDPRAWWTISFTPTEKAHLAVSITDEMPGARGSSIASVRTACGITGLLTTGSGDPQPRFDDLAVPRCARCARSRAARDLDKGIEATP